MRFQGDGDLRCNRRHALWSDREGLGMNGRRLVACFTLLIGLSVVPTVQAAANPDSRRVVLS